MGWRCSRRGVSSAPLVRLPSAAVLLVSALLVAAGACDATGSVSPGGATPAATATPSPTPTATPSPSAKPAPSPTPTKKPFFPQLVANGFNAFVGVTGAPAGSVCSVRAFLKSGREISGPALKPRTVTNPSQGVSWSDQDGQLLKLPSPAPSPGQDAYWQVSCTNPAFDPLSRTTTSTFQTP